LTLVLIPAFYDLVETKPPTAKTGWGSGINSAGLAADASIGQGAKK